MKVLFLLTVIGLILSGQQTRADDQSKSNTPQDTTPDTPPVLGTPDSELAETVKSSVGKVDEEDFDDKSSTGRVDEEGSDDKSSTGRVDEEGSHDKSSVGTVDDEGSKGDAVSGRLLAQYTTKTKAAFVTTTVSVLSTCFSATNTPPCMGRRKRNAWSGPVDVDGINGLLPDISASGDSSWDEENYNLGQSGKRSKRSFTVWSTVFSTYTLTSTSFFMGTTVTISGRCSITGLGSSCFG